jgi:hypothetical protein
MGFRICELLLQEMVVTQRMRRKALSACRVMG